MPKSDNRHEAAIERFAGAFKGSLERTQEQIRGGDRPPFTQKVVPTMLRDPYVAERLAQSFEARGMHDVAEKIRQKAPGVDTRPIGKNTDVVDQPEPYTLERPAEAPTRLDPGIY